MIDTLRLNRNVQGLALMQRKLGHTDTRRKDPVYVSHRVISDRDYRMKLRKFTYREGNGLVAADSHDYAQGQSSCGL